MSEATLERLRLRLGGRTKRDLIEGMICRSPHQNATDKAVCALEVYPIVMLMMAHDYPTRIWILDKGEKSSSAEVLDQAARERRWHGDQFGIDDCEGVTDVVDNSIVIVTSWRSLLVMRHEFAHAITTFFPPKAKRYFHSLYAQAAERRRFTEPLAAESLAEYVACGVSYLFFDDLRQELKEVDGELLTFVSKLVEQAEAISQEMSREPEGG